MGPQTGGPRAGVTCAPLRCRHTRGAAISGPRDASKDSSGWQLRVGGGASNLQRALSLGSTGMLAHPGHRGSGSPSATRGALGVACHCPSTPRQAPSLPPHSLPIALTSPFVSPPLTWLSCSLSPALPAHPVLLLDHNPSLSAPSQGREGTSETSPGLVCHWLAPLETFTSLAVGHSQTDFSCHRGSSGLKEPHFQGLGLEQDRREPLAL